MKKVIISVLGLSPQVLTEALYALYQEGRLVDEIHVITTSVGRDLIHAGLLASGEGAFFRFLDEYDIPRDRINFTPHNIHVLTNGDGYELDDIVTPEHNEALIKKCMELAWQLTKDSGQVVYFMIAGGRKTMSACLALAAQFYGRQCDRIYHVLVSPEFESCRDFYFPPKKSRLIKTRDKNGKICYRESKYARIWLVTMPFVSVRDRLTESDLAGPALPETLLASLIRDNPPYLIIDLIESKISWKGRELDLPPAQLALLTFFAMKRKECECNLTDGKCNRCYVPWDKIWENPEYRHQLKEIYGKIGKNLLYVRNMSGSSGISNIDFQNFSVYRSKLNKRLKENFGPLAENIMIQSCGEKNYKSYGLKINSRNIKIIR